MKRRMKYITNGKLSAVPPHIAMDMIWLKPPVMLRLTISIFPAFIRASAGDLSHPRTCGEKMPTTRQESAHAITALIRHARSATQSHDVLEERTRRIVVLVGVLQERTHLHVDFPVFGGGETVIFIAYGSTAGFAGAGSAGAGSAAVASPSPISEPASFWYRVSS